MNMISKLEPADATPADAPSGRRKLSKLQRASLVVAPVALLAAGYGLIARQAPAVAAPPPPTVVVANPLVRESQRMGRLCRPVRAEPLGRGASARLGRGDGDPLHRRRDRPQGQLLFTIDPRPFAAALAEARAGLASAQSDLALAHRSRPRRAAGRSVDAVSKSEVDRLRARVQAANAALAAHRPGSAAVRSTWSSPRSAHRSPAGSRTARSMPATSSPRAKGGQHAC
jgi:multidrug efflux system membrane fusion protein